MARILVSGTGFLQENLLKKIKAAGHYTVGINETTEGSSLCDELYVLDCRNPMKVLNFFKNVDFDAAITTCEDKRMLGLAMLANYKQLKFPTYAAVLNSIRKDLMKQCFIKNAIPCAKLYGVFSLKDVDRAMNIKYNYPVLIKPVDSSASKGVVLIHSSNEFVPAFYTSLNNSKCGKILIEEYIPGSEYSVESVVQDGQVYVIQITKKINTSPNFFVEMGHLQPSGLDFTTQKRVVELVAKVICSLGLDNCACHTEFKITEQNSIYIIENAPRLGGDYISSHLTTLSTGVDLEELLINISLGLKVLPQKTHNSCVKIVYFHFGTGKHIDKILSYEWVSKKYNLLLLNIFYKEGEIIQENINSKTRLGCYIIEGSSEINFKEIEKDIEKCIIFSY